MRSGAAGSPGRVAFRSQVANRTDPAAPGCDAWRNRGGRAHARRSLQNPARQPYHRRRSRARGTGAPGGLTIATLLQRFPGSDRHERPVHPSTQPQRRARRAPCRPSLRPARPPAPGARRAVGRTLPAARRSGHGPHPWGGTGCAGTDRPGRCAAKRRAPSDRRRLSGGRGWAHPLSPRPGRGHDRERQPRHHAAWPRPGARPAPFGQPRPFRHRRCRGALGRCQNPRVSRQHAWRSARRRPHRRPAGQHPFRAASDGRPRHRRQSRDGPEHHTPVARAPRNMWEPRFPNRASSRLPSSCCT